MHMGEPSRFIDEIDEQYKLTLSWRCNKKAYGTEEDSPACVITTGSARSFSTSSRFSSPSAKPSVNKQPSDYRPSIMGENIEMPI